MAEYTPGLLTVDDPSPQVYSDDDCSDHPVADFSCNHTCRDDLEQLANATRAAAAWNACAGIPTTTLQAAGPGAVLELLETLQDIESSTHHRVNMYERNGPQWTHNGQEYYDADLVIEGFRALRDLVRASLARFKPGEGA